MPIDFRLYIFDKPLDLSLLLHDPGQWALQAEIDDAFALGALLLTLF